MYIILCHTSAHLSHKVVRFLGHEDTAISVTSMVDADEHIKHAISKV